MKFLPLIWAALRRKPVRTIVTFLSVTAAFTLFGLMIGFVGTLDRMEAIAHADRIWTLSRFGGDDMPIAAARRIAGLPGVKGVTVTSYLTGYVGDPKNTTFMGFTDDQYGGIFPDWGPTPAQWEAIRHDRTAIMMSRMMADRYNKKLGDSFTIIAPQFLKADGSDVWTFKVVAIGQDVAMNPGGYIVGNYAYFDAARPAARQGKISEVDTLARDPAQTPALAGQIDRIFANSGNPTRSITERDIYAAGSAFGGMDIIGLAQELAMAGLMMILFLTANVIAQSVRERRSELATLMALGFSIRAVIALVTAEALMICMCGAVAGVLAAMPLASQVPKILPPGFGLPLPTVSTGVLAGAITAAIVLALASTILPALRLSRMDVAAALPGHA